MRQRSEPVRTVSLLCLFFIITFSYIETSKHSLTVEIVRWSLESDKPSLSLIMRKALLPASHCCTDYMPIDFALNHLSSFLHYLT